MPPRRSGPQVPYRRVADALRARLDAGEWLPVPDEAQLRLLLGQVADAARGRRWNPVDAQLARLRARLPEHDALAELEESERLFDDLGAVFFGAVTRLERAEHLIASDRLDDAREPVEDARETFAQLRATPWLDRAAAALGRPAAV